MVLLPPLLGGIRDGAGDPTLPNSAWGNLPPVFLCCRQGWPQRCTLPAACTLPAPLSPRNLRALPQAGHSPRGLSDPQCPTVLPPQAASEMLFPPFPPLPPCLWQQVPGCGNRGTLFGAAMLRCWASPPFPILLPAGVPSLGVSGLFTDVAILCIALPGFLLLFQPSGAFEVRL